MAGDALPARSVLVVDDVPEIVGLFIHIADRLDYPGLVVDTATDPRRAIALLQASPYDVVLTDYRMPHVDGVEVLRVARRANPHARLALMSGYNELPVDVGQLLALRIDAYLQKPVPVERAQTLLEALIRAEGPRLRELRAEAKRVEEALVGAGERERG